MDVVRRFIVICLCLAATGGVLAAESAAPPTPAKQTVEQLLLELAGDSLDVKKAAIAELTKLGDPRVVQLFDDYRKGNLYVWEDRVVLSVESREDASGEKKLALLDPLSREPITKEGTQVLAGKDAAKAIETGRRERALVNEAITLVNLYDKDTARRLSAVTKAGDNNMAAALAALRELAQSDPVKKIRRAAEESAAIIELRREGAEAETKSARIAAVTKLGELGSLRGLALMRDLARTDKELAATPEFGAAFNRIGRYEKVVDWVGYLFSGVSRGSILILVALGLAIIFGLMGVINMAQGELVMIGAYTTYVMQHVFLRWMPGSYDWYFIAAIPAAFIVAALVGMLIEVTIVRWLYGRPIDTLLATLGVGFLLVQAVRLMFGDNIGVKAPSWLQGGVEVAPEIVLPYARIFAIGFCAACIALMYFIVGKTKLGLLLQATTQNRAMAASLGVPTRRIDLYTFGLGAGLAGLAGCALTPIEGVTPDMGLNYNIDSFLVVVTGGVGKLAGAIWAGLGLGMLNKLFEPVVQAVWAKVLILLCVIVFIQWRPSGLFPAKGRLADA